MAWSTAGRREGAIQVVLVRPKQKVPRRRPLKQRAANNLCSTNGHWQVLSKYPPPAPVLSRKGGRATTATPSSCHELLNSLSQTRVIGRQSCTRAPPWTRWCRRPGHMEDERVRITTPNEKQSRHQTASSPITQPAQRQKTGYLRLKPS